MEKIFEKIANTVLGKWEKMSVEIFNYFLWIVLLVATYERVLSETKFERQNLFQVFFDGSFILFFAWSICAIAGYHVIRFLLIGIATNKKIGAQLFAKIIPDEYRILPLNIYYKQAMLANSKYINKELKLMNLNSQYIEEANQALNLITGVILKAVILIAFVIGKYSGMALAVLLFALVFCILVLLFLVAVLSTIKSKERLYHFLGKYING